MVKAKADADGGGEEVRTLYSAAIKRKLLLTAA